MASITPDPVAGRRKPRHAGKRQIGNHLKMSKLRFRIVNHSFTPAWKCWPRNLTNNLIKNQKLRSGIMSASSTKPAELSGALSPSCRTSAAQALTIVRDGVITGEGPTTKGRVHFSRELDADDAAWCARILTATAVEDQPVRRAEAEALFEISHAPAERPHGGRFDD